VDYVAMLALFLSYLLCSTYVSIASGLSSPECVTIRPIAIVTGGTRGIGSGISEALADAGYDLLLTYNTDNNAANGFADQLRARCADDDIRVECVGGDISLTSTRDDIFSRFDSRFGGRPLAVMVHNAGQYVGVTSDNVAGLTAGKPLSFGDGSLANNDGTTNMDSLQYYHRMYGEAFVDLCERSLARMSGTGSLVGISSPGVTASLYSPDSSYSMPGAGKCLMEYSMRIYAKIAAERRINANIIVPGVVRTEAWNRLAKTRGLPDETEMMKGIVDRIVPQKRSMAPRDIGDAVAFLCSDTGRFITGTVIPVDGGVHLQH